MQPIDDFRRLFRAVRNSHRRIMVNVALHKHLVTLKLIDGRLQIDRLPLNFVKLHLLVGHREGHEDRILARRIVKDPVVGRPQRLHKGIVLAEPHVIEDVLTQRLMQTLRRIHNLAQRATRLDRSHRLRPGQAQFVGHTMRRRLNNPLQHAPCSPVAAHFPLSDARNTHAAKPQELVVLMPSPLQHPINKVDAGLPVVGPCQDVSRPPQISRTPVERRQVDLDEVAEALVRQQNFRARVATREPRPTPLRLDRIDEARLRPTSLLHHIKDAAQVLCGRGRAEQDGVVGLLPVLIVVQPEVLLRLGKLNPLRIAPRD